MKKTGISIIIVLAFFTTTFLGCQKVSEDKIPPVIQLRGDNPLLLKQGCDYVEQGVLLSDDKDQPGAMQLTVTGEIIPDSVGTYFINYKVVDSDGNQASTQRMVVIKPVSSDDYEGTYDVSDTLRPMGSVISFYTSEVVVRSSNPPLIEIRNFNNLGVNFKSYMWHDSTGYIQVNYGLNDTLVSGNGFTYCEKAGFRLLYSVAITRNDSTFTEYHRSTFLLRSKK